MKKTLILLWGALSCATSMAQTIQGTVKDANGENLSSVNVVLVNNNKSTITDAKGKFIFSSLKLTDYRLQISFVGKSTVFKKVNLKDSSIVDLSTIVLYDSKFQTEEVVVTATKQNRLLNSIPASIEYISRKEIESFPSQKIDENLKYTTGVFVDRPFGIFGKSVVGMRGVVSSEPARQLTLIDGVPINKSDGGNVNWNRIINADIEHIELIKGPSSTLYGSNAMGGTINLITKRPYKKRLSGIASINYGTYNTQSGELNLMGKLKDSHKGLYYVLSAKTLKSDGYITVPDSMLSESDTSFFVTEKAVNTRLGYNFSDYSSFEIEYNYYNDHRGQGKKIQLEDGETADYDTQFIKSKYKAKLNDFFIDINCFYQLESYLRTIEKEKHNIYTLIDVASDRTDYGLLSAVRKNFTKQKLSFGIDFRLGKVDGKDKYKTSTDEIINTGKSNQFNIYLQDEIDFGNKLKGIASIHFSSVYFYDGAFLLQGTTGATNFMENFAGNLDNKKWNGWSPSISLQYNFSETFNIYSVVSRGFRAASLEDLTRTGFINIGYKKANPELSPETINNIELGTRLAKNKFLVTSNIYYSQGFDFMYYIVTDETIFGGRKKVYKKQNVSQVEIFGAEGSIKYNFSNWIDINFNYTFNNSTIKKFETQSDLVGKFLAYNPSNIVNLSTILSNKKLSASANLHWQDKIYLDDANDVIVNALLGLDIRISYRFYKTFSAGLNVQNIFNEQHLLSTDQISLGRFISFNLSFEF